MPRICFYVDVITTGIDIDYYNQYYIKVYNSPIIIKWYRNFHRTLQTVEHLWLIPRTHCLGIHSEFYLCWEDGRIKASWIEYNKSKYFKSKNKGEKGDLPILSLSPYVVCESKLAQLHSETNSLSSLQSWTFGASPLDLFHFSQGHSSLWSKSLTTPTHAILKGQHWVLSRNICTRCSGQECVAILRLFNYLPSHYTTPAGQGRFRGRQT